MKRWYRYDTQSGRFTGYTLVGDESFIQQNAAPGFDFVELDDFDWRRNRVDLETGALVACQPDKPDDTEDTLYTWDAVADDWRPTPTPAKLDRDARAKRAELLAASDWVTLRAADTGQPIPAEWSAYRAALRDITEQPGYPLNISWPQPPA